MKRYSSLVTLLILLLSVTPLAAQDRDARVALPGQLRLDMGADHLRAESRFGSGASDPWGLEERLDAGSFAALQAPAAALDDFLTLTSAHGTGSAVSGGDLHAGDFDFDAVVAARHLPIRLALGILSRIELGASVPIVLTQRHIRRFDVTGGNVGPNPDIAGNKALLAGLGSAGEALGGSSILPVSGSPAGEELQARTLATTGGTLSLPEDALTRAQIAALGFDRPTYPAAIWKAGDLEIDAHVQLVRSFSGHFPPPSSGRDYRLTLSGAYRFPAELATPTGSTNVPDPLVGYRGPTVGMVGDLFIGSQLWVSGGASASWLDREEDAELPPNPRPDEAISLDYLGDAAEVWLQPRVRLTRELSLGAMLQVHTVSGTETEGTTTSAGLSIRYSNLPGWAGGDAGRPMDAAAGFATQVSGPDGAARTGRAFIQLSIMPRLWGGGTPAVEVVQLVSGDGGDATLLE